MITRLIYLEIGFWEIVARNWKNRVKRAESGKKNTSEKYVGEKYKLIMYKCEAVAVDLYGNRSDEDEKYYKELTKKPDIRYMKLKLIEKYEPGTFPLSELRENGLKNVQGRSKATQQLLKYLNK